MAATEDSLNGDDELEAMTRTRSKQMGEETPRATTPVEPRLPRVSAEVLQQTRTELVNFYVSGVVSEGQSPGEELQRFHVPSEDLPDGFPSVRCSKGMKGRTSQTPNQDSFSISYFKDGSVVVCCTDGHGNDGHHAANHAAALIPHFLCKSSRYPDKMSDALVEAFESTQEDMVACAFHEGWECQYSGTTASVCVLKGSKMWIATAGDSRVVVGNAKTRKVIFASVDHKPSDEKELERIEKNGGECRTQEHTNFTAHRVFVKGQTEPGLSMSRSLGDGVVKEHGVIATPDVQEIDLTDESADDVLFVLLASDGIWEFITSEYAVKEIAKKINSEGPAKSLDRLVQDARKKWEEKENFKYIDDITGVLLNIKR